MISGYATACVTYMFWRSYRIGKAFENSPSRGGLTAQWQPGISGAAAAVYRNRSEPEKGTGPLESRVLSPFPDRADFSFCPTGVGSSLPCDVVYPPRASIAASHGSIREKRRAGRPFL